jgi:uncharacterized protein Usg
MVEPLEALAPVILPTIGPRIHVKLLGAVAVSDIFGLKPLQITEVVAVVNTGVGLTVTIMLYGVPGQEPIVEVGVTRYSTDPAVALPGLVRTWLIVPPEPLLAPVILPVIVPIVHAKLLAVLAVSTILGLDPLQMFAVAGLVTTGVGLTVTTILYGFPGHEPVTDVGVTRYSTVPDVELPGFVRTWLIVLPEPLLAPLINPVIVPIVQVKVLGVLAVKAIFGLVPLQVLAVLAVVTEGKGFTVIIILYGVPAQNPVIEVGVTRYSTVPAVALLGFVSTWLIVPPEPADAPVILPTIVPIVQVNVLGALAVNEMFGLVPLHVLAVAKLVTAGFGLTVTVIVYAGPGHDPVVEVGVTIYSTEPGIALLGLVSTWLIVLPDPATAPVILPVIVPIVQAKLLGALAVSAIFWLVPLQVLAVFAVVTTGVGLIVTVIV